jgi:hypothetical protein
LHKDFGVYSSILRVIHIFQGVIAAEKEYSQAGFGINMVEYEWHGG